MGATLGNYALRFARWQLYLRCLAVRVPRRASLLVFLAGLTMALTPGKLGEVLKAVLLRDLTGTAVSRVAPVVLAERLTDVGALLALGALGATALPHAGTLLGGGAAALLLTLTALRAPRLAAGAHAVLRDRPRLARFADPLRGFLAAGRALLAPRVLGAGAALSVASWFCECLALALVLRGLGLAVSLRTATFLYAFASLAGAASMLPGGLGVAEGSLTGLLAALGTPLPEAAAATLLVRAATLWLGVGLGTGTCLLAFGSRAVTAEGRSG